MIDKALKELKFNIINARSAKSKALEAIKILVEKQVIPIARAKMRVKVIMDSNKYNTIKEAFQSSFVADLESEKTQSQDVEILFLVEPENYKPLVEKVRAVKGRIELVDTAVIQDGELKL